MEIRDSLCAQKIGRRAMTTSLFENIKSQYLEIGEYYKNG